MHWLHLLLPIFCSIVAVLCYQNYESTRKLLALIFFNLFYFFFFYSFYFLSNQINQLLLNHFLHFHFHFHFHFLNYYHYFYYYYHYYYYEFCWHLLQKSIIFNQLKLVHFLNFLYFSLFIFTIPLYCETVINLNLLIY